MDSQRHTLTQAPRRGGLRLSDLADLVRWEQTLFALPIALASGLWAAQGWPPLFVVVFTLVAMVAARTAGMSANRLIDARIDAVNPRTADRPLPSGRMTAGTVTQLLVGSLALLAGAAYLLNPLCFRLCPLAFFLLLIYSYLKRWTWACHFGLGAVQACGPLGAWFAVTGQFAWPPMWLALGVAFWMAGFDILYALADESHDKKHGIHSVPARFGSVKACLISRLCHGLAFLFWCLFAATVEAGSFFAVGLGAVGSLLVWEHVLVRPGKLDRLPIAFFRVNSIISTVLLLATLGDLYL
jgi:4-hydroxybenzoate polyprenyltransferase